MRVLVFNFEMNKASSNGFMVKWVRALAEKVERVVVITLSKGEFEVPANVEVYSIGKEWGANRIQRVFLFYKYLWLVLRKEKIDVCFSHMTTMFTIMAAPVLAVANIPMATWYAHRSVNLRMKLAYHLSQRIFTVNKASYQYLHEKVEYLGHGIDITALSCNKKINRGELPEKILCVGRISPMKDPETFIRAIEILVRQGVNIKGILVGGAPARDEKYFQKIISLVQELRLESRVDIVGTLPHEQAVSYYRLCAVHVNSAPPDHSVDKTPLEAMACGKPSLSSVIGLRETFGLYADDLHFKYGDAQDLASKVKALLELREEEYVEIATYLQSRTHEMHNLDNLSENLIQNFTSILEEKREDKIS